MTQQEQQVSPEETIQTLQQLLNIKKQPNNRVGVRHSHLTEKRG